MFTLLDCDFRLFFFDLKLIDYIQQGDNTIFEETANNTNTLESSTCNLKKSNSSSVKSADLSKDKNSYPTATKKKKNRKGGLSMFLSGALDDMTKDVAAPAPPPPPKMEGPAWGGAKVAKGSTTLREIQDEQRKTIGKQMSESKEQADLLDCKSEGKIRFASFLSSKPIPVVPSQAFQVTDGERNTPPWSASGTPPPSRPSLRDIQMQQVGQLFISLFFWISSKLKSILNLFKQESDTAICFSYLAERKTTTSTIK